MLSYITSFSVCYSSAKGSLREPLPGAPGEAFVCGLGKERESLGNSPLK